MLETKDWYFLYKCKCCGKIYNPSVTRCMSTKIIAVMSDFCLGKQVSDVLDGTPCQTTIHYCDDKTFGYADFIGVTSDPKSLRGESVE